MKGGKKLPGYLGLCFSNVNKIKKIARMCQVLDLLYVFAKRCKGKKKKRTSKGKKNTRISWSLNFYTVLPFSNTNVAPCMFMYVCMYIYIYTYIRIYIHICIHTRTHTHTHTHTHMYIYIYICTSIHIYVCNIKTRD